MVFKSPAKLIKHELLKEQASAKKSLLGGLFGNDGGGRTIAKTTPS